MKMDPEKRQNLTRGAPPRKPFQWRKYVTSGVAFTFVVVGVTGVIFQFFFKNPILTSIHGWLGVAMVVAAVFHIYHNWKPLRNYLKDRYVFALLVPVVLVAVYFAFGQKQAPRGPNPRQVVARLSQAKTVDLARVFGKNTTDVVTAMRNDHLVVRSADETVADLAADNGQRPDALLAYFIR